MEPPKTAKVQIPEIRANVMRPREDERKGAAAGVLSKLGLGGGSGAGGAGGLAAGGGLLAGKAGIVALIVAGSSVAAGIGLFTYSGSPSQPQAGAGVFAHDNGSAPADSAQAAASAATRPSATVASSLDDFHQANHGAVPDPYAPAKQADVKDAAAPAQVAGSATAPGDNTMTASPGTRPPSAMPRPKMIASHGFGGAAESAGGSSGASGGGVVAQRTPGGNVSQFARAATGESMALRAGRGVTGAQRRSAILNGFGGAAAQLKAHSQALRSNLGSGNVSSAGSGAVMDGAAPAGAIGAGAAGITGGGVGAGGKGVDSSPGQSVKTSLKDVQAPPAPTGNNGGANLTGYQNFVTAGVVGIGVAVVALVALAFIEAKIKALLAAPTPVTWGAVAGFYHAAQWIAGIGTAAAAAATTMGAAIMAKYPTERMPGMILTGVGAFLTLQLGYKLANLLSPGDLPKDDAAQLTTQQATNIKNSFDGFNLMNTLGMGAAK